MVQDPPSSSSQKLEPLASDLEKVGQRDLLALRRVYRATSQNLFAVCHRITNSRETAEDVLQEVYIKVWNRAAAYDRERAHPLAWLAAIARNSAIDAVRSQRRWQNQDLASVDEVPEKPLLIDEELIDQEQYDRALAMVNDLGEDALANVKAVYFQGATYAELAEREGVPVGTVKSRVRRALIVLNQRWSGD